MARSRVQCLSHPHPRIHRRPIEAASLAPFARASRVGRPAILAGIVVADLVIFFVRPAHQHKAIRRKTQSDAECLRVAMSIAVPIARDGSHGFVSGSAIAVSSAAAADNQLLLQPIVIVLQVVARRVTRGRCRIFIFSLGLIVRNPLLCRRGPHVIGGRLA